METGDVMVLKPNSRKPKAKYSNKKTDVDGIKFDSKAEALRYSQLKLLKQAGEITDFSLQPRYLLLEGYQSPATRKRVQPIYYKADFLVTYPDGHTEVEDVKGMKTPVYVLKKKMFEQRYGIPIVEVEV